MPKTRTPTSDARERITDFSLLNDDDLFLFNEGTHRSLQDRMGAHPRTIDGTAGTVFSVWAPSATAVSVIGDWNGWHTGQTVLEPRGSSGIWEGFAPDVHKGAIYKYAIDGPNGFHAEKADPFALRSEEPPKTGSVVWELDYEWGDQQWLGERKGRNALTAPESVYEVHVGSWRRKLEEGNRWLSYRELAHELADYVKHLGFTHVELLPVMEHPFYGSWGYQTTGYFAPSARYGEPQDLMYLIDHLHQNGIGVILDWVPSHFPEDAHGLARFDGTHLYEHADPKQGFHPDWKSAIFNYGRNEVRSFLLSSALHWLKTYHADGLRVDAVASMLYLDYSRNEGEWVPNEYGGRENLEAISLLRRLNEDVYGDVPDAQTVAEESTAWPGVSRPTYMGGLGFGLKWDMGWMHDTLRYFSHEPIHRRYHQNELTFRGIYAFTENFMLPLSHDEVVHGKGSLLGKMPGDDWQKFANLRLLLSYQWVTPGKKLLFMGGELGQWSEWNHESSVDWHLLDFDSHRGIANLVEDLNRLYRGWPALHERDSDPTGFEWIDANDVEASVLSFLRLGSDPGQTVLCVFNLTPVPRASYRLGVPQKGFWRELFNSDAPRYWGSGQGNMGGVESVPVPVHGRPHSISVTLPPLGCLMFAPESG
jgi:1,4-alpha-glucan branching enzyme